MISALTNPADLVARILQPLARSLEEARQHLALEDVDDGRAEEEPGPAAEDGTAVVRLTPHPQPAPESRQHAAPTSGIALSGHRTTPAVSPATAEVTGSMAHTTARTAGLNRHPEAAPVAEGRRPPSSVTLRMPDADPGTAPTFEPLPRTAPATSAPLPPRNDTALPPVSAPASLGTDNPSQPVGPARPATVPAAIRLIRPDETTGLMPALETDANRPPPVAPDFHAAGTRSADAPPMSTHRLATQPATPLPHSASTAPTPTPHHWRLRPAPANEARPLAPTPADAEAAAPPALTRGTAAPSLLPRNPALTRVMQAMDPVLDKAWQLTDAALPAGRDAPSDVSADAPRVTNQFNVTVALGGEATDTAGRDPRQLEDALVALLRDAARRQGLDV